MDKNQARAGEKVIGYILIILSIFVLHQATKISGVFPDLTSPGAFPMMVAVVMFILSVYVLIENSRLSSKKYDSLSLYIRDISKIVLSKDILFVTFLLLLYSVFLSSIGFNIATILFLWIGISYLTAGNLIRNLFISVINLAIILFIFNFIFKVILP